MRFAELDVPAQVQEGIRAAGFATATPIQEAALPLALRGKDVAGQAQTGTGKTAAFLIAAFTRLLRTRRPAPAGRRAARADHRARRGSWWCRSRRTRGSSAASPGSGRRWCSAAWTTSSSGSRSRGLSTSWSARPGRLIDYLKQHVWSPAKVEVLVIDEADRMFDMGFIADLRFILRRLPPPEARQSFLFSATLSFRVLELTWEFMNNPAQITIVAAAGDGRAGRAGALPRGPRGEVRPPARACCAARGAGAS